MPAIARVGVDNVTDSEGSGVILGPGTVGVNVNGSTISVIGDAVAPHGTHLNETIVTGSATVFAGGIGVVRVGDTGSLGGVVASGSPDTNAG